MKIFHIKKTGFDFFHFVAQHKRDLEQWQFLHVTVQDPTKKVTVTEVETFLKQHVQGKNVALLIMENELLVFAPKDEGQPLIKFEKSVYENFSTDILRAKLKDFSGDGLEQFGKIVEPHIQPQDELSRLAYTRMFRPGNCILVLDDDEMVLKQLDKILSGYGNVITLKNSDNFFEIYRQYAPDIVFLDIHLRRSKGNEVLRRLKQTIDPFAHVVMISSDTQQSMIMDLKAGGADGFVVKPFDRHRLYQQLVKAPTVLVKVA